MIFRKCLKKTIILMNINPSYRQMVINRLRTQVTLSIITMLLIVKKYLIQKTVKGNRNEHLS